MIPSKNKSKIADRLAILEAEINISYLTNLFGNPTAYGYGRKVKLPKGRYKKILSESNL